MTTSSILRSLLLLLLLLPGCLRPDGVVPVPVEPDRVVVDPVDPVTPDHGPLKVLILYEVDQLGQLPPSQLAAIRSTNVLAWLDSQGADYRIWDQHVDTTHAEPFWQDAIKLPHDSLPWIWITGGGRRGVNGPLPKTEAELLKLLKDEG